MRGGVLFCLSYSSLAPSCSALSPLAHCWSRSSGAVAVCPLPRPSPLAAAVALRCQLLSSKGQDPNSSSSSSSSSGRPEPKDTAMMGPDAAHPKQDQERSQGTKSTPPPPPAAATTTTTKPLEPPERPLPGDCCGSGCVRCVWDVYYEELEAYNNSLSLSANNSNPNSSSSSNNNNHDSSSPPPPNR